jgi:uncharacterized protein (TIGR02246 family)
MSTARRALSLIAAASLFFSCSPQSNTAKDEGAVRELAAQYARAWNAHDMTALGNLLTEDADWVGIQGLHWVGRERIVREQAIRHLDALKDSRWSARAVQVHFVRPGVALVILNWTLTGMREPGGALRTRVGVMSWVVVQDGGWKIRSAQETVIGALTTLDAPHDSATGR